MKKEIFAPLHGGDVLRKDVPCEYKWNVNDIYANEEAWRKGLEDAKTLLHKIEDFKGKLN